MPKRILYFFLGLIGLLSLLCSIAAASVTSESLMAKGFSLHARTASFGVYPNRYPDYARAITRYLDGKSDEITVPNEKTGAESLAFSDRENRHMKDVRGIVTFLKWARWLGGGIVIAALAALYLLRRRERERFLRDALRGFAFGAIAILAAAAALGVWGLVNFSGLFWAFHQTVFTNDLWLLNPQTDLLLALMPLPFFTWYAGEMLKSMLPILAAMLLIIIAYFKTKERKA